MAFNKRIMDKIEKACDGNDAMLGYMHDIVMHEMSGAKQYTKEYERILKEHAKEEEGRQ